MKRTCEPELMDTDAQAIAYASADFSDTDDRLVAEITAFTGPLSGTVVDLGCGPGNIALRIARAHPDAHVLAVDGAQAMLNLGHAALKGAWADVADRVEFVRHFLPSDALPTDATAVVSNSLLHHLTNPSVLWETVRHVAAPGAAIFIGDLRRPPTPQEADRITALYASDAPPVLRHDFHQSLHAAFEADEVRDQLREAGLDKLTVREVGDRHVWIYGRTPR